MPNERNGRKVALPDENQPEWRPQDENGERNRRSMSDRDDRDWDRHWDDRTSRMTDRDERSRDRSTERYGQGQSGYSAGRYESDRSYGSRNQSEMSDWEQSRDRGGDERFSGGRGGSAWNPSDRSGAGMHGSHGNYGHTGHWDDERGGGYLGQSGQQMGYSDDSRQQSQRAGGHGAQGQGGMYGQGGYAEGMHGRGGQQDRYGAQGYQGWSPAQDQDQRYSEQRRHGGGRAIGEGRYSHPGQHGYGQGFGQAGIGGFGAHGIGRGYSDQGVSGSGYGHQAEHDTSFRGGQREYGRDDSRRDFGPRMNRDLGNDTYGGPGFSHPGDPGYRSYGNPNYRDPDYRPMNEAYGLQGDEEFSHEAMYGRGRERNMYGDRAHGMHRSEHQQMFGRRVGLHRGKGPAGYTRSDDRIREMVCDCLTDHDEIDASNIHVTVKNGEVTLSGTVEDRGTKRMAEDIIENLSGVKEVVNNLRIADRTTATASGTHARGPAIEKSPPEQALQSGSSGTSTTTTSSGNGSDKRHRA